MTECVAPCRFEYTHRTGYAKGDDKRYMGGAQHMKKKLRQEAEVQCAAPSSARSRLTAKMQGWVMLGSV